MHPDPNDPRLTALALGELDELDEAERAELEQHLAGCPACRQEVSRLRELGAALSHELGKEPLPAADVRPICLPPKNRRATRLYVFATAASLLILGGFGSIVVIRAFRTGNEAPQVAWSGSLESYDPEGQIGASQEPMGPGLPGLAASAKTNLSAELLRSDEVDRSAAPIRLGISQSPSPESSHNRAVGPDDKLVRQYVAEAARAPSRAKKPIIFSSDGLSSSPSAPAANLGTNGSVNPVQDMTLPIKSEPSPKRQFAAGAPAAAAPQGTESASGQDGVPPPQSLTVTGGGVFGGRGSGMRRRTGGQAPSEADWKRLTMSRARLRPLDLGPPQQPDLEFNTEAYDRVVDNPFLDVSKNPLSTFSIDVDTASYSNVRRFLMEGNSLPPKDAVRIEELVNYFAYDYAGPKDDAPFAAHIEAAECPWQPTHRLVRIGLKGRVIADEDRPASNLVFLLDVSGSMAPANKLPLVRQAMSMLVRKLGDRDRVAIVVYAGASGLVLPSTSCEQKETILAALEHLQAGGSTNGGDGIQLAYQVAAKNLVRGGTNRVILCTDGDFNVGVTNRGDLTRLIEKEAAGGVFLTVLGFGMGNLKDATLEQLADKGNGNYGYIDSQAEAQKVLIDQLGGTLVTIAKDVKIQVEFNPARVGSYRLIGYENRLLRDEDFNNDKKDAGEIGAGHTVTALYEVAPAGQPSGAGAVDPLKYQQPPKPAADANPELLTLKLRYKQPEGQTSKLIESPFTDAGEKWAGSSRDFRFAAAVAAFGMILRESPYKGHATLDAVQEWATEGQGEDRAGYRRDFFPLLDKAKSLLNK